MLEVLSAGKFGQEKGDGTRADLVCPLLNVSTPTGPKLWL